MAVEWYCKEKAASVPKILGYEVEDKETGAWSFLLLWYGFAWNRVETWASHFETPEHLRKILKALSESQSIIHRLRGDLLVRNVPQRYTTDLKLQIVTDSDMGLAPIRIRLPQVPGQTNDKTSVVHWVGSCVIDSALRS